MYEVNSNTLFGVNVVIVNLDELNECFINNYIDFFKRHANIDYTNKYFMELDVNYGGEYSTYGSAAQLDIIYYDEDDYEGKSPTNLPDAEKYIPMFLEDVFGFKPSIIAINSAMAYIISSEDSPKDY